MKSFFLLIFIGALVALCSCGEETTNPPADVFTYDTLDIPLGSDTSFMRIREVLPEPDGEPNEEAFRIMYLGGDTVSLIGWKIKSGNGAEWDLSKYMTMYPDQIRLIPSDKDAGMLDDGFDVVTLVSPAGTNIQSVPYGPAPGKGLWVMAPKSGYVVITFKNGKEIKRELKY